MYYIFSIKDNYFKNNSKYLYELLCTLKNIHKENYSYGVGLYYNICNLFDTNILNNYLKSKTNLYQKDNKFYFDDKNYLEVRRSCCITASRYLKEVLCIMYIYNKNIFVCNFNSDEYFWLSDKFK